MSAFTVTVSRDGVEEHIPIVAASSLDARSVLMACTDYDESEIVAVEYN